MSPVTFRLRPNPLEYESRSTAGPPDIFPLRAFFIPPETIDLHSTCPGIVHNLIELIREVCETEFKQNGILMRGAITKEEFNKVPAVKLPKLRKKLIVGQAYVPQSDTYIEKDSSINDEIDKLRHIEDRKSVV